MRVREGEACPSRYLPPDRINAFSGWLVLDDRAEFYCKQSKTLVGFDTYRTHFPPTGLLVCVVQPRVQVGRPALDGRPRQAATGAYTRALLPRFTLFNLQPCMQLYKVESGDQRADGALGRDGTNHVRHAVGRPGKRVKRVGVPSSSFLCRAPATQPLKKNSIHDCNCNCMCTTSNLTCEAHFLSEHPPHPLQGIRARRHIRRKTAPARCPPPSDWEGRPGSDVRDVRGVRHPRCIEVWRGLWARHVH